MKCKDVREKMPSYASGELPDATTSAIKTHLKECSCCRDEYEAMDKALGDLVRARRSFDAPNVLSAVKAETARVSHGRTINWKAYGFAAMAACVVLACMIHARRPAVERPTQIAHSQPVQHKQHQVFRATSSVPTPIRRTRVTGHSIKRRNSGRLIVHTTPPSKSIQKPVRHDAPGDEIVATFVPYIVIPDEDVQSDMTSTVVASPGINPEVRMVMRGIDDDVRLSHSRVELRASDSELSRIRALRLLETTPIQVQIYN